jgi:acetylornithine/succinyldiaminopimelate/putrescine aminotransferase
MATSVFDPSRATTLELIAERNRSRCPAFMLTSAFVNAESAKLGYLLSRRLGDGDRRGGDRLTFFANSGLEGVAGAVKLARHTAVKRKQDEGGWILYVDGKEPTASFFNPLDAPPEQALSPHIRHVPSVAEALDQVGERRWAAVILTRTTETDAQVADCERLMSAAAHGGALRMVSTIELDHVQSMTGGPAADVHIFGESLAGRQVPFGCITMTTEAYQVWNNPVDSLAHTSTFGGNGTCLAVVIDTLRRHDLLTAADEAMLTRIDGSMRERLNAFRRYVNPHTAMGMELSGLALDVVSAVGGTLELADGREILDCAGGAGANLRGHNPPDLPEAVLARHDPEHDYFADLSDLLTRLTGYEEIFPAVSGASAVEVALTLAMLANPGRRKLVTFLGNYSGKSLGSMNLSKHGPQYTESDRDAFKPYYPDLVYLDPFADDAVPRLRSLLSSGEVALVWFEAIQGMLCKPLPEPVLEVISSLKESGGYLIGIDEVMAGSWRNGSGFFAYEGLVEGCDVTALAKPLSDMTLPMGVAFARSEVVERARATNAPHVERLRAHYRNGLSAHIALHSFSAVTSPEAQARRGVAQTILREGLAKVAAESKLFEASAGRGGHVRLVPKRRWFPFHSRSQLGQLLEATLANLILRDCGVLVAQQRFFPPIFSEPDMMRRVVRRLETGTRRYTPLTVYVHAVRQVARFAIAETLRKRRAAKAKV